MNKQRFFTGMIVVSLVLVMLAILLSAKAIASSGAEISTNNPADQAQKVRQNPVININPSRSHLDVCFDVPVSERASCRNASQAPILSNRGSIDECVDLSLPERATCRKQNNLPVQ